MLKTVAQMEVGETGIIASLPSGEVGKKLKQKGLLEGIEIKLVRVNKDLPREYIVETCSHLIALDETEASQVIVINTTRPVHKPWFLPQRPLFWLSKPSFH